jgi:hypothetical protein
MLVFQSKGVTRIFMHEIKRVREKQENGYNQIHMNYLYSLQHVTMTTYLKG